ncbi:MAG: insulinase family protein [Acidobacteria bacterium]|nr:insulinase family protein [Acidobacteriota bacterium]
MYRKTTLENGVRIITEMIPEVRSTSIGVVLNAGPRTETSSQCGLAHLTEHLMFQGTSSRSALQIARLMDSAGGYMGGFTTQDYTYYSATVLAEYSTYALDLFGDILLNSIFPQDSVEKEKEAVICEIEAARDNPDQRVRQLLKTTAWPNHPLGRPVAGYTETVKTLTREDVIYFAHQHYLPTNLIVAAAGQLDHDDFVAQVRDAFWRMLGDGLTPAVTPPAPKMSVVTENSPVSQAYFCIGLRTFPYTHPDRYALHVLDKVLGGGISSRLFRRIREELGLVYYLGSEYLAFLEDSMFVIEGSTSPEYLQMVLELTLAELTKLFTWETPVTDEELLIAQTHLRGQHLISGENTDTRMSRLATQELYFGRHIPTDEIAAHLLAVDLPALQRLGQTVLMDALRQATIAVVGPNVSESCNVERLEKQLSLFDSTILQRV